MTLRARVSSIAIMTVCWPLACVYTVLTMCCRRQPPRDRDSEDKFRFERRQKMAPRPLPLRPVQKTLTLPIPEKISLHPTSKRGHTLDQNRSQLMRLPPELREMIWRAVLGDSTMHMILKEQKLGHLRCKAPSALECPLGYNGHTLSRECCWGIVDSANIWSPLSGDKEPTDGNVIPLLRTCRQM